MTTKIFTSETFSVEVERRYLNSISESFEPDSYLEIASDLMAENGIDQEDGAALISPTLKAKIAAQCKSRNLLKEKQTTHKVFDEF